MRTLVAALAALAVIAPAAHGKGLTSAEVCGATGCTQLDPDEHMLGGGAPAEGPTAGVAFVRFNFELMAPEGEAPPKLSMLYVPDLELIRVEGDGAWMTPGDPALLRRATRGVEVLPASRFPESELEPVPPAPRPEPTAGDSGLSPWWLALLLLPAAALLAIRGTGDRRKVYGLAGAQHGRGPDRARPQG